MPCRQKFSWKFAARRVDRRKLTSDELDPRRMKPERNIAPGRPEQSAHPFPNILFLFTEKCTETTM